MPRAQQRASGALILTVLSFSLCSYSPILICALFSHYSQQRSETIVCELVVANSRAAYELQQTHGLPFASKRTVNAARRTTKILYQSRVLEATVTTTTTALYQGRVLAADGSELLTEGQINLAHDVVETSQNIVDIFV